MAPKLSKKEQARLVAFHYFSHPKKGILAIVREVAVPNGIPVPVALEILHAAEQFSQLRQKNYAAGLKIIRDPEWVEGMWNAHQDMRIARDRARGPARKSGPKKTPAKGNEPLSPTELIKRYGSNADARSVSEIHQWVGRFLIGATPTNQREKEFCEFIRATPGMRERIRKTYEKRETNLSTERASQKARSMRALEDAGRLVDIREKLDKKTRIPLQKKVGTDAVNALILGPQHAYRDLGPGKSKTRKGPPAAPHRAQRARRVR